MNALVPAFAVLVVLAFASHGKPSHQPLPLQDERQLNPAWLREEDDLSYLNPRNAGGKGKKPKAKHNPPPAGYRHSQRRCRR